jgi:hypothetical protein
MPNTEQYKPIVALQTGCGFCDKIKSNYKSVLNSGKVKWVDLSTDKIPTGYAMPSGVPALCTNRGCKEGLGPVEEYLKSFSREKKETMEGEKQDTTAIDVGIIVAGLAIPVMVLFSKFL